MERSFYRQEHRKGSQAVGSGDGSHRLRAAGDRLRAATTTGSGGDARGAELRDLPGRRRLALEHQPDAGEPDVRRLDRQHGRTVSTAASGLRRSLWLCAAGGRQHHAHDARLLRLRRRERQHRVSVHRVDADRAGERCACVHAQQGHLPSVRALRGIVERRRSDGWLRCVVGPALARAATRGLDERGRGWATDLAGGASVRRDRAGSSITRSDSPRSAPIAATSGRRGIKRVRRATPRCRRWARGSV